MMTYVPCATMTSGGGGQAMAQYAVQWFMYEGDWRLCHLCHMCRPFHHDMEGGGGIRKCAAARAVTWVSSLAVQGVPMPGTSSVLAVESFPMPGTIGDFGNAKCLHARTYGYFWQCRVSLCPELGVFLAVQSVPMPGHKGVFGGAKCPHLEGHLEGMSCAGLKSYGSTPPRGGEREGRGGHWDCETCM